MGCPWWNTAVFGALALLMLMMALSLVYVARQVRDANRKGGES